ncbi:MAG: hypothetical protein IJ214_01920 [Clostridia bacterium]|nr:hypothetical protein [Clostridia bacterium]
MSDIKALLARNTNVDGWRITEKATVSYELFFVHKNLETVRATDTVDTSVTVYVDHDGKKGDSTFSVYRSMSEADINKKIETAAGRARLVFNEPYDLPGAGTLDAQLPTNMRDEDPKALARKIADAVFAADTLAGGSINACEIFLYRDTLRVINSRGVDKTQRLWRVMIEAIPTFTTEKESVELYEDYRFTQFDPEKITAEIASRMAEVRDRALAVKPQTPMTVNVLLRPREIRRLAWELADDLGYGAVYAHANLHKQGDDLQENGDGDKLTVTLRGVVNGSERSAYFDDDGTALRDTRVIRDGIVENYYGSSRFGQYLKIPEPSGVLPCLSLAAGTLKAEEIKKAPYIECVSLSGLQVEMYSDYIGGEIRLAYYFDGEKKIPVTGISMSARLSEVLKHLLLSDQVCVDGAYEGPDKLLLKDVAVL